MEEREGGVNHKSNIYHVIVPLIAILLCTNNAKMVMELI